MASFQASKVFALHEGNSSYIDFNYIYSVENSQRHRDDFASLRKAAQGGCEFCGMVWAHHIRDGEAHNDQKCQCKAFLGGTVRLVLYQDVNDDSPILFVVVMPPKTGLPKSARSFYGPDGYVAARFEMCIAKGI